jgi:hypothetical protein
MEDIMDNNKFNKLVLSSVLTAGFALAASGIAHGKQSQSAQAPGKMTSFEPTEGLGAQIKEMTESRCAVEVGKNYQFTIEKEDGEAYPQVIACKPVK